MKNLLILFILFCSAGLLAQINLAGFSYQNFPKTKIMDSLNNQEASFQEYNVFFNLPKKLKNEKTALINGLRYSLVQAKVFNDARFLSNENEKSLHRITYNLAIIHSFNPKWTWSTILRPTLSSDFTQDLSSDDFLFLGTTMLTRRLGLHFVVGAGLTYTTRTGQPQFIPVAKMKLEKKRNTIDLLFPSHITYLRHFGPTGKLKIGAKAALSGGNFHVTFEDFIPTSQKLINKVIYSRVNIGLVVDLHLTKVLKLEAFGGYTVNRQYNFEDQGGTEYEFESENGPFFSLGLILVAPQK